MAGAAGRRGIVAWLAVSQLLAVVALVPWVVIAGLSVMAFDTGISATAVALVLPLWLYPLAVLACGVSSWLLFRRGRGRAAAVVTSLPLLFAVPMLGYIVYLTATAS
jgi:hypothetical protein